jgi:hypothetical protein
MDTLDDRNSNSDFYIYNTISQCEVNSWNVKHIFYVTKKVITHPSKWQLGIIYLIISAQNNNHICTPMFLKQKLQDFWTILNWWKKDWEAQINKGEGKVVLEDFPTPNSCYFKKPLL